jgi:hypothetical protein
MIAPGIAFVSAAVLLTGCVSAPAPSFQAAWFLAARVEPAGDTLYIGLLNQSDAPLTVAEIVVNGEASAGEAGWRLKGPITLEPGRMLIRPASDFKRNRNPFPPACHLPISVVVILAPDRRAVSAEVRGRMPNFLPADWERACTS